MREPLNPYERYEIYGMTDADLHAEREREAVETAEKNDYLTIHYTEPKTVDEIVEELEMILDGEF